MSAGLEIEWGRTGAQGVGVEPFNVYTPTLFRQRFRRSPRQYELGAAIRDNRPVGYSIPASKKAKTNKSRTRARGRFHDTAKLVIAQSEHRELLGDDERTFGVNQQVAHARGCYKSGSSSHSAALDGWRLKCPGLSLSYSPLSRRAPCSWQTRCKRFARRSWRIH